MSRAVRTLAVGMSIVLVALGVATSSVAASPGRTPSNWATIDTIVDPPGGPCGTSTHPPLRPGDTGPAVRHLQCLLRERGFDVPTDGYYGRETGAALLAFQRQCGFVVDGILGPQTWRALHTGC